MINKDAAMEYRVFRVCVIGPKGSGKTSLVNCIVNKWGNGYFPGYTGDLRQYCVMDCFEPEDHVDQKPFFLTFHDLVAFDDPVLNTSKNLQTSLEKAIDNSGKLENVDLNRLPWKQENRPYTVYMFVVKMQDETAHKKIAGIIDEIKKREDFKVGGKHAKLITKKFIILTHSDCQRVDGSGNYLSSDIDRFSSFAKIMNVSCTTGENVNDVIKELVDMLKDNVFEDFEKYIWANSSNPQQRNKEDANRKEKQNDDEDNVEQTEDIKDLKLSKLSDVNKNKEKPFWKGLWPF